MPGRTNNGSIYEDDPEMDMAQVFDSIDIQSIELAFFVQSLNEEVPSSIVWATAPTVGGRPLPSVETWEWRMRPWPILIFIY